MTLTNIVFPTSFSAVEALSINDCAQLDRLTHDQRAELEAGRAYLHAINLRRPPNGLVHQDLPVDFRIKVAAYCEAVIARTCATAT